MAVFSSLVPLLLLFLSLSSPYVNGKLENTCSTEVQNVASCLPFVTIGSKLDKPDDLCCSGLKTVLDTKAECLCAALKKSASKGVKVDIIKAATLFSVCKLDSLPPPTPPTPPTPSTPPTPPTPPTPHSPPSPHSGSSLISGLSFAISGVLVVFALSYLSPLDIFS